MADAKICPITQESIRHGIVLRGAHFELRAILDMLRIHGARSYHPYERTPFTDEELKTIYVSALHLEPVYLVEQGWMLPTQFFAQFKEPQPAIVNAVELPAPNNRCQGYEISVFLLVLVGIILPLPFWLS
jgi:hypothetical protein